MCLHKDDYEYALGPKYAEILKWHGSEYVRVT